MLPMDAVGMLNGVLNVAIDEIRAIANGDVSLGQTHANDASTSMAGGTLASAHFSQVDIAQEIAAQTAAVHEVFTSTIAGVISDLESFKALLLESAKAHADTDEGAHQSLLAVAAKMQRHNYSSSKAYDKARRDAGTALPTTAQAGADANAHPVQHSAGNAGGGPRRAGLA